MITALVTLLMLRSDVEATVLKLPGQMFTTTETTVTNVYTFTLINKTIKNYNNLEIKLLSIKGAVKVVGDLVSLKRGGLTEGTLFITIDKSLLTSNKIALKLGIFNGKHLIETTTTNFPSPLKIN
jgi:hypothetical protein